MINIKISVNIHVSMIWVKNYDPQIKEEKNKQS